MFVCLFVFLVSFYQSTSNIFFAVVCLSQQHNTMTTTLESVVWLNPPSPCWRRAQTVPFVFIPNRVPATQTDVNQCWHMSPMLLGFSRLLLQSSCSLSQPTRLFQMQKFSQISKIISLLLFTVLCLPYGLVNGSWNYMPTFYLFTDTDNQCDKAWCF